MIQTALIQNAHKDLVTDASYDFYGLRLATAGLDQRIKVWALDESTGQWGLGEEWKAHDAALTKVAWAHPEFGPIIASASFDRTVKIWEEVPSPSQGDTANMNGAPNSVGGGGNAPGLGRTGSGGTGAGTGAGGASSTTITLNNGTRWIERATLAEAKGSVRAVEFAPRHFGLKIASISSDNVLRIYSCLEQPNLSSWTVEEYDIPSLPSPQNGLKPINPSNTTADNAAGTSTILPSLTNTGITTGDSTGTTTTGLAGLPSTSTLGPSSSGLFPSSSTIGPTSAFAATGTAGATSVFGGGGPTPTPFGFGSGTGNAGLGQPPSFAFGGTGPSNTIPASQSTSVGQPSGSLSGAGVNPATGLNTGSAFTNPAAATGAAAAGVGGVGAGSSVGGSVAGSAPGTQSTRPGVGIREADGGWCLSWCKEQYWGETIAVGWGVGGIVKIIQFNPSRRAQTLLTLEASPPAGALSLTAISGRGSGATRQQASNTGTPTAGTGSSNDQGADDVSGSTTTAYSITSVAWAPSCGRSFHLVATGSRDGRVRVWKLRPGAPVGSNGSNGVGADSSMDEVDEVVGGGMQPLDGSEKYQWHAALVAEFDDHESCVGRVEWNVTGTVLSSVGNDGRVRLWKQTVGGVWRTAGVISVEQSDERGTAAGDVEME